MWSLCKKQGLNKTSTERVRLICGRGRGIKGERTLRTDGIDRKNELRKAFGC